MSARVLFTLPTLVIRLDGCLDMNTNCSWAAAKACLAILFASALFGCGSGNGNPTTHPASEFLYAASENGITAFPFMHTVHMARVQKRLSTRPRRRPQSFLTELLPLAVPTG